jgi:hypothetical protein
LAFTMQLRALTGANSITTAKTNCIEPCAYLLSVFTALPNTRHFTQIRALCGHGDEELDMRLWWRRRLTAQPGMIYFQPASTFT